MLGLLRKASSILLKDTSSAGTRDANDTCDSPCDIPQNILAFRTITTLLAKIQQERPIAYSNASDRRDISPEKKQELKISNAFANLAVTNTDVVALVSKNLGDRLEVIACSNHDQSSDNDQPVNPQSLSKLLLFGTFCVLGILVGNWS